MTRPRCNILAIIGLLLVTSIWAVPTLADPQPPRIDWKEFLDQLGEDPESVVGEHMC